LKRALIAIAAVSVVALVVSAPAGAGSELVYAPKDCTTPKVEPKRITLACGDAGILLKHMGWNDWNAEKVSGQGQLYVNDCDPNCAAGSFDKYKAKVRLLNIQTYTCGGETLPMYRRAHVRFPGEAPPHPNNFRSFKLACNS
jgi:hypothetical protein